MYDFTYKKASSVDDAVSSVTSAEEGVFMSGGMTLIPTLKLRLAKPSDVIDLAGIGDLAGISASGGTIKVGAMTRHFQVAGAKEIAEAIPGLAKLAGGIGDPAVRYRGTIGGSVANNDPAADYPAAVVALGATVRTNKREITADDFFKGLFETALEPGEMVIGVDFPVPESSAYMKFPNPASRYAIVGVFVAQTSGGVRVAVTGAGSNVFRVAEMEKALDGAFTPESVENISISDSDLNSDIHASAEYRAHLVTIMAKRAVAEAIG